LLDDAPASLLAAVVETLHSEKGVPRVEVWSSIRRLAKQVKSRRDLWQ
jgi:hypothetical protein